MTLLLTPALLYGQKVHTISGKIIDAETKEPLPFASVGIKGVSVNTISNLQGEFDFHFSSAHVDKTFKISMLGYVDVEVEIETLINQDSLLFPMVPAVQMLDEVVVKEYIPAEDVLRLALERVEENYPMEPYLMEAFYRDLKKIGGVYFSLLEAAIEIYDEDYEEPRNKTRLRERVALAEVRKSVGYDNKFTRYFDQSNLLEDLLLHNPVKYRQFAESDAFYQNLQRFPNTWYNGHEVYVIGYLEKQKLLIYIDMKTYSILRVENEVLFDDMILKKRKDLYSKFEYKKTIFDYREFNGRMYPNYIHVVSRINWYETGTDKMKFETEVMQQLLINQVKPNSEVELENFNKMRRYGLQYQNPPYNEEFWDNYNVIKRTPLDKEIIEDLENMGALPEGMKN